MTTVPPVAPPSTSLYANAPTTPANQDMNSQMFLQLLVTQLKTQNPDSPMDSNQMITQTSQLASMQALTTLSQTNTDNFALQMRTAAAGLIGQNASYLDAKGNSVSGQVTAVSFSSQVPTVTIGGVSVPLDILTGVTTPTASTTPTDTDKD
jgi:flagellar basal-body rod modification protein FlgD